VGIGGFAGIFGNRSAAGGGGERIGVLRKIGRDRLISIDGNGYWIGTAAGIPAPTAETIAGIRGCR